MQLVGNFVISKIKDAWMTLWEEKKMTIVACM